MRSNNAQTDRDAPDIGQRLKTLRTERGLSLARLAEMTGISDATLSRVETGKSLTSAHNLYTLSKALNVDITAFFDEDAHPLRSGIRSISRKSAEQPIPTEHFLTQVFAGDLAHKRMHPSLNTVTKQRLEDVGGLSAHAGEEFLFVVSGSLVLHSAHYAPVLLEAGDTIYFDGSMPHAYLAQGDTPAEILVINTMNTQTQMGEDQ
ncbi:helix-turn-helix domain-containing protein [uncultured Sulfitobacter sp.]|uniref:helix-turn-helix domain-containing protein n=1 Tax=uncultured Sulfitobacter sp. TaxID=191468 RepID=UPI0026145AFE|nr:XRE family transcriptional regulator [uncultured Sulfitobacter sp.]